MIDGPRQANLLRIAYASSEGSGEPAHPRSLARTFAARSYKQWVKRNLQTESQIPGHAQLKFVMTECSKTQIRLSGLRCWHRFVNLAQLQKSCLEQISITKRNTMWAPSSEFFRAHMHNYVTIPLADWHVQTNAIRFPTFCGMMAAMDICLININYVSSSFSVSDLR